MRNIFIICSLLLCISACGEKENKPPPPKPVVPLMLESTIGGAGKTVSGLVQPKDTASVSFEVPGKVEKVYVDLGESFKKGTVLAMLDDRIFRLEVRQRQSELSEAKARLTEAKKDYDRLEKLNNSGAVSDAQRDVAKAQYISARDQVNIAKAQLGIAQENLDDTRIIAPYDGSVNARYIEPSQRISPQIVAFDIEGKGALEVAALISEDDVNQLALNDVVPLTFNALGDDIYQAKISEIGSQARTGSAFPIVMTVDSPPGALKSGMTASVRLPLSNHAQNEAGYRIPVSAFAAGKEQDYYVMHLQQHVPKEKTEEIKEEERKGGDARLNYIVKKTSVRIINMDEQYARIEADLNAGDRIVRTGIVFLQDGQSVMPISDKRTQYNP